MRKHKFLKLIYISLMAFLVSCTSSQTAAPPDAGDISSTVPSTLAPTDSPAPTPTHSSALSPEMIQNKNGVLIYDDRVNILSINLDSGEIKVLISRPELQLILSEDKSEQSYTYGYKRPIPIELSPDLKKAYVTICASLDSRFRCVFEDYIYALEDKSAVKLTLPTDTYGVYWKWSPDGTKLAGAAWTYNEAYELSRFYSINSDGTDLQSLAPVTNGHWQFVWHPGGRIILPQTYVSNFQSLFVDGSNKADISIEGLEWDDKLECLSFSPDSNKIAFVIRREAIRDRDWLYTTNSDFSELTLVKELNIETRYTCNIDWSPRQDIVHLAYTYEAREETGEIDEQGRFQPLDVVINLENNEFVELPDNSRVCGWAVNGDLAYEKFDFTGEEIGIDVLGLPNVDPLNLPEEVKKNIQHCPIQWLNEDLAFEVPVGLSVPNACLVGAAIEDEEDEKPIPALFDILEVSSSLDGEMLTTVMRFSDSNENLAEYTTPGIFDYYNGWEVLVDADNNVLTGDNLGLEYRISLVIIPNADGSSPSLGKAVLKYNSAQKNYDRFETLQVSFLPEQKTLTLTGRIPEISTNSRLVFLSRKVEQVNNGVPSLISDRVCN
jgi:hypothetical protein